MPWKNSLTIKGYVFYLEAELKKIVIVMITLFLASCADGNDNKDVITRTKDNVSYVNAYFELTVEKPIEWYSQDPESTMKMSKVGSTVMAGDNQNMKALIDASLKSSVPLFAFFEKMPGTPVKTNPNIVSVAENISIMPGVKSGCDYLFHARQLIENSALKLNLTEGCSTVEINESKLGFFDAHVTLNGVEIYQRYHACIKGEHAISIIQTYFDDSSKEKVDSILKSIHLKCE